LYAYIVYFASRKVSIKKFYYELTTTIFWPKMNNWSAINWSRKFVLICNQPSRSTQPGHPPWVGAVSTGDGFLVIVRGRNGEFRVAIGPVSSSIGILPSWLKTLALNTPSWWYAGLIGFKICWLRGPMGKSFHAIDLIVYCANGGQYKTYIQSIKHNNQNTQTHHIITQIKDYSSDSTKNCCVHEMLP